MQVNNILSMTMIVIFIMVAFSSQNVYGFTSIINATWNDVQLQPFDEVVPTEDKPLEFFFASQDENNTDLATNFQCMIYRINEDADLDKDNIQFGIDLDGNGIGDMAKSDLTLVASDNCDEDTSSGKISYTGSSEGTYLFIVAANIVTNKEPVISAAHPFIIPPVRSATDLSISAVMWNELQVKRFGEVIPSQDRPIEFAFQSKNEENKDLSYNFRCVVYRINDDANLDTDNIQNGVDLDGNGAGDIAQFHLKQVASDNCGVDTSEGYISYMNFAPGTYVFLVTGNPLANKEPVISAAHPFIVRL